ncbi:hypothetical protein CYLTODRAFT_413873 [Cylindrobasidium torrendii FP15055 ss-10]|uniref:C2H2-type domain-containing protein n=1 Tax=Cylindrobasidium torrendii FP15055 ss-10 TaxID=1314674 RepID=A0A0D7B0C7_9AGAR|nr:hypothetical protein CYLTODRAFT_413873 [Cylindrobasidium torrendii FP15055 ss-10]
MLSPPSSLGKRRRASPEVNGHSTDAGPPRKEHKRIEKWVIDRASDKAAAKKANDRGKTEGDFALLSKAYPHTCASNGHCFIVFKTPLDKMLRKWKCPLNGCQSIPAMDFEDLQDHCKWEHPNGSCPRRDHMNGSTIKTSPACLSAALSNHIIRVHYGAGNFVCPACGRRASDRVGTLVKHMLACANMRAKEERMRLQKKGEGPYEGPYDDDKEDRADGH